MPVSLGRFKKPPLAGGFTIVELLVTLFVAAVFLTAGYQLYIMVIRADGQTKSQTIAQNTAQDYLERYRASVPSPCVASAPLTNSPITVDGIASVKISVTVSCPKGSSVLTLSQIDVVLKYGNPQKQLALSAWSYSPGICGDGYILVPGNASLGTTTFCVMKYEAKNVNGKAVSQAEGTPWNTITWSDAYLVSAAACSSCHLISNAEWMTIAASIISVPSNWSGGAVGSGALYRGHNDNDPSNILAASADDTNSYYGTNNSATSGADQRRTLKLNNGEVIWDLAGNLQELTDSLIGPGQQPGIAGETSYAAKEWNDSALQWNGFPAESRPSAISTTVAGYSTAQGIGYINSNAGDTSTHPLVRGGAYTSARPSGILTIGLDFDLTTIANSRTGFRVASGINDQPIQLSQPTSCPTGFIPVPGNALFGTVGFCVMKYEAKIQGNDNGSQTYSSSFVPESRASGTPWVYISWQNAVVESSTVCSGCHLMSDAQWMTIAANVLSVPSNWSGGEVGSGPTYKGNSNSDPNVALAASTDDSDGYYGIGATTGQHRRTLTLTNGQVIWDFPGNVWEYTNLTIGDGLQPGLADDSAFIWRDWNTPGLPMNGLPSVSQASALALLPDLSKITQMTSNSGIGMLYSDYTAVGIKVYSRGGAYNNSGAGITTLGLSYVMTNTYSNAGFRVTK